MVNDCPICYELISHNINCVTTECGHTFHTGCLMKHTVHNGYNCPYCRASMAAAATETCPGNNDDGNVNSVSETFVEANYENDDLNPELYDEYVLDGFRWMFQRVTTGHIFEQDAEDPYTDAFESWQIQIEDNAREFQTEVDRRGDIILDVLKKIKALSHDDLVKGYLYSIDEFFNGSTDFAKYNQKVTSTLKSILVRGDSNVERWRGGEIREIRDGERQRWSNGVEM